MDRELAGAVLQRWEAGLPVAETTLYKAASALGIPPEVALMEARYYTYLDSYLTEKRAMAPAERVVFSLAAGIDPFAMEKTASAHGFSTDELILEALRENGFAPDLEKIANLSAVGGDPTVDPMMAQAEEAMMAPPQQNAVVQQQPAARFKPSPMAPEQAGVSPEGNLDSLLQETQQAHGPQATENGGLPPAGMQEPPPPPPSPEERIQQVAPNLDPQTLSRYGEQLARFEEGFGMPINDPKQMVKFVKELQKVDGKRIDQGIKAMGQQLEQEQAQELGVDSTPTIDGPAGANQQVMTPQTQGNAPQGGPAQGGSAPGQPKPPVKRPPQPNPEEDPAIQQAAEKVAHAARALARAALRN